MLNKEGLTIYNKYIYESITSLAFVTDVILHPNLGEIDKNVGHILSPKL